jgi:hypothetical protein
MTEKQLLNDLRYILRITAKMQAREKKAFDVGILEFDQIMGRCQMSLKKSGDKNWQTGKL